MEAGAGTTPLPKSMFNSMLYPFVAFMVQDFMFPGEASTPYIDKVVSFYAGLIASCFSLAQFISSMVWGRVSDKTGRRAVLLIGLLGNTVTAPLFGLAPTYTLAVMARCLSGLINGNVGVAKAYGKEITDDSNQAKMFSYFGFAWGLGVMLGPLLGGSLSHISNRWPSVFPPGSLWDSHPYLMPMVVCSLLSLVGFIIGAFVLEGREPSQKRYKKSVGLMHNTEFIICTTIYALCGLAFLGFQEVFPFWCKAQTDGGGLGFTDESVIGKIQASGGLAVISFQLLVVPWAMNRFGILQLMRSCTTVCLFVFFLVPFLNLLSGTPLYVGLVTMYLLFAAIQASVLTAIAIGINNSVLSGQLGTANGMAQSAVSLCRFLGPAAYGGLFGWSVDNGLGFPLDVHFIFNVSTLIVAIVLVLLYCLSKQVNRRKNSAELLNSPLLGSV